MNRERLADLLQQLHVELSDADNLDQELSEQLQAATEEIQQLLERDEAEAEAQPSIAPSSGVIAQLRAAANQFEDSHPALTNTVGRIADALAQVGI